MEIDLFYLDTFGNYDKVLCLSLSTRNMITIASFALRNSALVMRDTGKM